MPWKPGETGNKGGRPGYKDPETGKTLAELAKAHTSAALRALVSVMDSADAPPAAKVSAATAILDRAHGRPHQSLGIEMKTDEAAAGLLEQARRRALENRPH